MGNSQYCCNYKEFDIHGQALSAMGINKEMTPRQLALLREENEKKRLLAEAKKFYP